MYWLSLIFLGLVLAQFEDTSSFSLFMEGTCSNTTLFCVLKGNSQTISTLISATDTLDFIVKPHIGSYALMTVTWTPLSSGGISLTGNMTFGTHNSRDHTIFFDAEGTTAGNQDYFFSATAGVVTGGLGVYDGYQGIITTAGGAANADATRVMALVSGHLWPGQGHKLAKQ